MGHASVKCAPQAWRSTHPLLPQILEGGGDRIAEGKVVLLEAALKGAKNVRGVHPLHTKEKSVAIAAAALPFSEFWGFCTFFEHF